MAISPEEIALGVKRQDIKDITQAAMMNRASLSYDATPNGDATLQAKRLELCRRAARDPDRYVYQFTWVALVTTTITTLVDYTGAVAATVLNQTIWDRMADLLIDASELPP